MKKIVYIDMDGVLADFETGIAALSEETLKKYEGRLDEVPGIFSLMKPIPGAIEAVHKLQEEFDLYILSTSPWNSPTAASDKVQWVTRYLDDVFHKKMIITHCKNLCKGDYLIDDCDKNGTSEFEGEWIQFGSEQFPDWPSVVTYLLDAVEEYGEGDEEDLDDEFIYQVWQYHPEEDSFDVIETFADLDEAFQYKDKLNEKFREEIAWVESNVDNDFYDFDKNKFVDLYFNWKIWKYEVGTGMRVLLEKYESGEEAKRRKAELQKEFPQDILYIMYYGEGQDPDYGISLEVQKKRESDKG